MGLLFYNTLQDTYLEQPTSVAMGFFDGLHQGHQAVITKAVSKRKEGFLPIVFTFTMNSLRPDKKPTEGYALITKDDKRALLAKWGVQVTVCPDFTEFKDMDAPTFLEEVLMKRFHAKHVCCGSDFRFGKNAEAGVSILSPLCTIRGITVDAVEQVSVEGQRVSSTWIRQALREGDVEKAALLLGRPFGYDFAVVEGKKLGRTLQFPTINQPIPKSFVAPRHGVYVSVAQALGKWYPSVTNIGLRPTVEESEALNSETFIYGFSGDLYGARVPVRLLNFLRPEQRFESIEQLRAQISQDTIKAAAMAGIYLKNNSGFLLA